jgi:excisionase family DNA binding protein
MVTKISDQDKPYLTTVEAAAYLGLSPHTLNMWRSESRGPGYMKFGGRVRYTRAALDAWAAGRTVTPGKEV